METTSIQPAVEAGKSSRLPAGSTLEVSPGVHVPHPHAEVNLPGAGDPRLGDTKAVTEYTKVEVQTVGKDEAKDDTQTVTVASVQQKPLADEVKPKVVTVNPTARPVAESTGTLVSGAAAPANTTLAVEQPTLNKTE